MKLSATNHLICKLICGKRGKNMSLSGGQKMEDLKQLRLDALSEAEATMWGESEDQPPQKKKKVGEHIVVEISVEGVGVSLLCSRKRSSNSDLLVLLEPSMLQAVFDYCIYKKTVGHAKPKGPTTRLAIIGLRLQQIQVMRTECICLVLKRLATDVSTQHGNIACFIGNAHKALAQDLVTTLVH